MRLLRVIRSTDPRTGGPIEGLLRSSEVLVRHGHEIEIASLENHSFSNPSSIPVYALGTGAGKYGYQPRLAPWLVQNASRYDVVVVHGLWNYISVGSWRGLRKTGVPYVVFPHGMLDPWFLEHHRLKHVAKQCLWYMAEGRVLHDAKAVLFTSEEERQRAQHAFHGFPYKARVVRYGASEPAERPATYQASFLLRYPRLIGRQFLLYLGRVHRKKGIDLLLRAFAAEVPTTESRLDVVIAGPDEEGTQKELFALVRSLGIADRVHWMGMLRDEFKWGALFAAEALILPSHQENFGIVVAEAMACSLPVLISDKVNIWRQAASAGGGMVQPDTLEGTKMLLRSFLAFSAAQRARMRAAARATYEKHFGIDAAAADLISAIREALHLPVV